MTLAILDAHADTLNVLRREGRDFFERSALGQADLPRLIDGGVRWQVFSICAAGEELRGSAAAVHAMEQIALFQRIVRLGQGRVRHARTVAELEAPGAELACLLMFEGAEPFLGQPALFELFHALGLRVLSLTWNGPSDLAKGIGAAGGLTEKGREFLPLLAAKPLVLDISHLAPQGVEDVLSIWPRPLIASHANVHALCPHPRNLTDAQLEAVADTGGVIGLTFVPYFLHSSGHAGIDDVVRHACYIAERVGIEHLGFGSDFDGGLREYVDGLETAARYPALFAALRSAGFSESDLEKVASGNWRRVFRANLDDVSAIHPPFGGNP